MACVVGISVDQRGRKELYSRRESFLDAKGEND
jgi:hypothetical protein